VSLESETFELLQENGKPLKEKLVKNCELVKLHS